MRLRLSAFRDTLARMPDETTRIADKVRGVASEKRASQEQVGEILKLSRHSVNLRFNGKVPFTATEILTLSWAWDEPYSRFFPERAIARPLAEAVAS